jgi:hypothetical protein
MKRTVFKTLDAAKAHILKLEASIAKATKFDPNPIIDGESDTSDPATLDEAKGAIADLRAENATLKARIAELEKQPKEDKKAQPKDADPDPDDKKAGITEASLAATILTASDYRKVWAAQRALDAMQTARVNSAVYPKARK